MKTYAIAAVSLLLDVETPKVMQFVVPTAARGSPEFLATVRSGVTRLPLAEPLYFSYALRDDREFVSRREVDVRYDCDQS